MMFLTSGLYLVEIAVSTFDAIMLDKDDARQEKFSLTDISLAIILSPKLSQGVADFNVFVIGCLVIGFMDHYSPYVEQLPFYATGWLFILLEEAIFKSLIPQYMAPSVAIEYVSKYVPAEKIE